MELEEGQFLEEGKMECWIEKGKILQRLFFITVYNYYLAFWGRHEPFYNIFKWKK